MLQVNQYKKSCYLTDSEKDKIYEYFKAMFEVDNVQEVRWYVDKYNQTVIDIIGLDKPESKVVGE